MACFRPIRAWRSKIANPTGKRSLVFKESEASMHFAPIDIPCGQCIGCKLERSRQWAVRCMHESSMYDDNCYITLTYDDEHLPSDGSVHVEHFQKFMKRLRKKYPREKGNSIRFFHCGEYGEVCKYCGLSEFYCKCPKFVPTLGRPHYHACLFNFDFEDKELLKIKDGNRLYTSSILEKLWPYGFCSIGAVTFASAAYVARYITKKINGEKSEEHYKGRKPEYITMSRRPGIGKDWFDEFRSDLDNDFCVVNGKKVGLPKFYDSQLSDIELKERKKKRRYAAIEHEENNTGKRLYSRERCQEARANLLKRSFEND